jgi:hypothetical protein
MVSASSSFSASGERPVSAASRSTVSIRAASRAGSTASVAAGCVCCCSISNLHEKVISPIADYTTASDRNLEAMRLASGGLDRVSRLPGARQHRAQKSRDPLPDRGATA